MSKNSLIGLIVVAVVLLGIYLVAAGGPTETETTVTNESPIIAPGENTSPGTTTTNLPIEPAAAEARKQLAARLSVAEGSIVIMQVSDMTWTDGCLGLGGPAESCMQSLVPGFRVELLASGKTYIYRTDKTGSSVRAEN